MSIGARGSELGGSSAAAPIQLNLTAPGWTVVMMIAASVFISGASRVAIGFLIPLAAAVIIVVGVSWLLLSRQSFTLVPSRTVTHQPEGIPVRIRTTGGSQPLRVKLLFGGAEHEAGLDGEPTDLELRTEHTGATDYIRANVSCSVLGLGIAQRWQTHSTAMLHWAPAPETERMPTPDAVDEVARLRAYVPGDRMSRVSWPVTARTGQMHVRAAGEGHEEFTVVLNAAPAGFDGSELPLVQTATLVGQLLEDGHQVRLVTTERGARHRDGLRQAAIDNPRVEPELSAAAIELVVVDGFVTDEDDLARRLALVEPGPSVTWPYGTWVDISTAGIRTLP